MNLESPQTPGPELPPPPPPQPPAPPSEPLAEPRSHGVERLLAAVRTRQRRQLWLQGAMLGLATLLVLGGAGGFLALVAPAAGRWLLLLSPVAGALVACVFGVWLSLRTVGDDFRTARLIGERQPALSLDVLAAVELSREQGAQAQYSEELAEAFLRQMDLRADQVDVGTVVDDTRLKHAALVLGGVALVMTVVLGLAGTSWRAGLTKALESARLAPLAEQREPITGDIELTYRYPAYTGLAPRTVPGTNGEVSAPAGTEVQLKTRSDREVERAELVVNGETLPLTVNDKRELTGTFIAKKAGTYHFVFYGTSRKPIATGPDIPLNVEADAPPQVQLLTPAAEIEIDPGQQVTLKYEASDDYGLNGLALVFRTPGAKEETRIPLPREDGRRDKGTYTWNLGTLQVQPGDRISYYVEAKDNDAVEGPKRGVSRTQVLRVYSAAEHRRAALEKAEALWGRMVDHLADRLEGADRDRVKDPQKVASGQAVDTSGLTLVADMRALSQELRRERDTPAELITALANISETLGQRVRATSDLRRIYLRTQQRRAGDDFGTGNRLGALVEDEIAELEKDILYLESLLDRQKLEALQELAKQLAAERRELANLIEQYKQNPDEQVREQVMQQIQEVRNRIQELMQRMAEMRQGIRDEHLNAEALQEMMKDQDMQSALDDVERLMREGKTDEALAKLQELSMQMDEMLNGLNEAQDEFGNEQYPELAKKFGDFMNELEQTAQEQQRVADATKALRDQARQQNKDRLAERGKAMKDELQRQLEQVQKDYEKLRPEDLNSRASRPLEEAQAELENARNALKVDDYDLAAEAAQRASEAAQQLASYGEQQRSLDELYGNPDDVRQQSAELAERLEKDAKSVEDVNRKLQSLFPPPGSQMSQQDKQQLQQLAQQQQSLEQKARELRQQMQDMEQMAPIFGQEAGDQMEEIGRRMGEASQRMQGKDPNRGYGEQQAALEGLKQFQQQMKESQKGRGKGRGLPLPMGMGKSEGNGRDPRDKVEIPDEEAYQAPKEFRKDLLDAMKEGTPEKYRDQVKRYYEELVK
ncbi:DUF4175 domain-containing protein [Archangium violaceum]|uniref:DUF4175 family protein n=1 Tax=Archangium violaceum TaxID=83451 RepID=UPI002B28DC5D|nr:DUF4175 domain-containing protein [Archangium violaceum]